MRGFIIVVQLNVLCISKSGKLNIYGYLLFGCGAIRICCHQLLGRHQRRISNQSRITGYAVELYTCVDLEYFLCNRPVVVIFDLLIRCKTNVASASLVSALYGNTVGTILAIVLYACAADLEKWELLPPFPPWLTVTLVFGLAAIASVPGTAMTAAAIISAAYFFFISLFLPFPALELLLFQTLRKPFLSRILYKKD